MSAPAPARKSIRYAASWNTSHPFVTENGGGLFLPDGYFALHLEGAARVARYFCVPFGRPYAEAAAAVQEIAALADAAAVGYAQMSIREIANNTHQSQPLAELDRQREEVRALLRRRNRGCHSQIFGNCH